MEETEDYFLVFIHMGIVTLHAIEVSEAKAVTLAILISLVYFAESSFELRKIVRKWWMKHKDAARRERETAK